MTDTDSLVRRLRQFQADEPGFPPLFSAAADEIERLRSQLEQAQSVLSTAADLHCTHEKCPLGGITLTVVARPEAPPFPGASKRANKCD